MFFTPIINFDKHFLIPFLILSQPSTQSPRPRKFLNGIQCGLVKSTEQRTNSVTLSPQQNGSTRQRPRRASVTTNDTTQPPFTRPLSRVGVLAPHERPSTPCPAPILVAKSVCTTVSKSPRPPSAKYRPGHTGDPAVTQRSQKFNSDTSDVDQLAEFHHVIRIPTRTYRTSVRGLSTVQTTQTAGEQRGADNLMRKPEPGNLMWFYKSSNYYSQTQATSFAHTGSSKTCNSEIRTFNLTAIELIHFVNRTMVMKIKSQ